MIELRQGTRTYRQGTAEIHALDPVDLAVTDQEFVAVTGPSGSGKSTLLHVIGGLDIVNVVSHLTFLSDCQSFEVVVFPPWLILTVIILSTGIALGAGPVPTSRAANLSPVQAPRCE